MAKVYNEKTVSEMRDALKCGKGTLERLNYDFFNGLRLTMAGIRIELFIDKVTNRRMGQNVISNHTISTEYTNVWKQYAPGRFLISDYRKDIRDKEGRCPYFIVHYKVGETALRAIIRELFENAPKMREEMRDFDLDGHIYTIVKICPDDPEDDTWLSGMGKVDIMHTMHIDEPQVPDIESDSEPDVDVDVATTYVNY